jgi:hypothetical protein
MLLSAPHECLTFNIYVTYFFQHQRRGKEGLGSVSDEAAERHIRLVGQRRHRQRLFENRQSHCVYRDFCHLHNNGRCHS